MQAKPEAVRAEDRGIRDNSRFCRTDFADRRSRNARGEHRFVCQCLHLPVAQGTFGLCSEAIVLSLLQRADSRFGQYSRLELAFARGALPSLPLRDTVSYFLIELFSGLGAALIFAKYGWVAAICFMAQFGLLCTLLRSTSDRSAVRPGSVALLALSTFALLLTQGGQHLMAYPIETLALGLIIGGWICMQRRTGWLVCLVCVCAGFAAGPVGLALSALALAALCVWFPRSARFPLYVDCALLLAVCFQPLWR